MPTAPTPITPHATPLPDTADRASYGSRGRALFVWETETLAPGVNALADNVYANALEAEESVAAAAAITGAAMWVAATNYATGAAAISLVDYQTYRRKSPGGVNATDPSASPTLWEPVGGKRVTKAGDTDLGDMTWADGKYIRKDEMRWSPQYKRCLFETSHANSTTMVGAKPSGTGTGSGFFATNNHASEFVEMSIGPTGAQILVGKDFSEFGDSYLPLYFTVGDALRMTIGNTGQVTVHGTNMLIGATSYPANVNTGLYSLNGVSSTGYRSHAGTAGAYTTDWWNLHWSGSAMALWVGTTNVGNLTITSDYRIKRDVRDMEGGALERVARLRPITYRYADAPELSFCATDDMEREGFLAHELYEVVRSSVNGEKDAPNRIQTLQLDPLVALLTKAMQEQQAQIAALAAEVAALKDQRRTH